MIEMIRDPLTHIVRNAVDHGIETPAERLKAGKREIGLLSVSARQSGNQILIDIVDDGRGIDGKRLVEKAIAAGLVDKHEGARLSPAAGAPRARARPRAEKPIAAGLVEKNEGARLSPKEQLQLIFEAGLSTAREVT